MPTAAPLLSIDINRRAREPLHRQLYIALTKLILSGRLQPGMQLPATRVLANDLGVARNTVLTAYQQLHAEGYLEGRVGSGSFVPITLPEVVRKNKVRTTNTTAPTALRTSGRGEALASLARNRAKPHIAFVPGLPALDKFPYALWSGLLAKTWRRPPSTLTLLGDGAGWLPLREAIAQHLGLARGLNCSADQIVVVSGLQHAIGLIAQALTNRGDQALIEDPGYAGIRNSLMVAGLKLRYRPVDDEGLIIASAPPARLVCVAPARHYPLGITMSLSRRLAVLEWARRHDAVVVEDDYDSEFRYAGHPLATLQSLDREGRVIFVGSFSKTLFPGLRIGYLVVPESLIDIFRRLALVIGDHPPATAQPALAAFIADGHFTRHLRRMRRLYEGRQKSLVAAANRYLSNMLTPQMQDAGMHVVAEISPRFLRKQSDKVISERATDAGLSVPALSVHYIKAPPRQGLLMGYAALSELEMDSAVTRLAKVIKSFS